MTYDERHNKEKINMAEILFAIAVLVLSIMGTLAVLSLQ